MSPATFEHDETATTDATVLGRWVTQQVYDPGFKEAVVAQIEALEHLPPRWDGYDAPAIDRAITRAAIKLVTDLRPHIARRPRVVPLASGGVQFEWQTGVGPQARSLELAFENETTVHYLRWQPAAHIEDENVVHVANLAVIEQLIRWFSRADV